MPADKSQLIEIEGLRDEALRSTSSGRAELAVGELLRVTDMAAASPEDRLLKALEAEYLANPIQYRNTLDVCEGNERVAARHVLDHMVRLLEHGKPWPMVKSMAHFDGFCGDVVRGNVEGRIAELRRRGGELRAMGLVPRSIRE
jgi:hypothetical protein